MQDQPQAAEQINYPSIVFRVKGELFCANSKYISTILQLPDYEKLPDSHPCITGIFPYRGDIIQMFDLRTALQIPSLAQEYEEFSMMLDARKQDHVNWVNELERSVMAGEEFTLATDPHKCKLGMWYDSFSCENSAVNFHLRKIEEPHEKLHAAALETARCEQKCDLCSREECLKSVLERVKEQSMTVILKLLEECKEIFKNSVYHEMALVLSGDSRLGLVVDEVLSVEELYPAEGQEAMKLLHTSPYIAGVVKSRKLDGLILELNLPAISGEAEQEQAS